MTAYTGVVNLDPAHARLAPPLVEATVEVAWVDGSANPGCEDEAGVRPASPAASLLCSYRFWRSRGFRWDGHASGQDTRVRAVENSLLLALGEVQLVRRVGVDPGSGHRGVVVGRRVRETECVPQFVNHSAVPALDAR